MIPASATASASLTPSPAQRWPVTSEARNLLLAELDHLAAEVARPATAPPDAGADEAASPVLDLSIARAARRLERLRAVLAGAELVDDPGRAVIGRRVTVREDDATEETYALVAPGDGDPGQGWISADSPLGTAVLDRRAGDAVEIPAPGGRRQVTVVWVG